MAKMTDLERKMLATMGEPKQCSAKPSDWLGTGLFLVALVAAIVIVLGPDIIARLDEANRTHITHITRGR